MRQIIILLSVLFGVNSDTAAQVARTKPFIVDTIQHIARLNIQTDHFADKFIEVFKQNKLDARSAGSWQKVLEEVVNAKMGNDEDAADVSVDIQDGIIELSAGSEEQLQKAIKTLKPYLASPGKINAFLTEPEKKEKPKPGRKEKEEKEEEE